MPMNVQAYAYNNHMNTHLTYLYKICTNTHVYIHTCTHMCEYTQNMHAYNINTYICMYIQNV